MDKKLEKLDNAFLFVISIVGLLFTVIQVYSGGIEGLVQISPLLFLGIALPFYIGYIRGAIEYNSLIERIRGWVYLAVSVSAFFALSVSRLDFLGAWNFVVYFVFIGFGAFSAYYLERWFKDIFGLKEGTDSLCAISGTLVSSISLAFSIWFMISAISELRTTFAYSQSLLLDFLLAYLSFWIFVRLEKILRYIIVGDAETTVITKLIEIAKKEKNNSFYLLVIALPLNMLVWSILPQNRKFDFFWITGLVLLSLGVFIGGSQAYSIPIVPDILILTSTVFLTVETFGFLRSKKIDFRIIKNRNISRYRKASKLK